MRVSAPGAAPWCAPDDERITPGSGASSAPDASRRGAPAVERRARRDVHRRPASRAAALRGGPGADPAVLLAPAPPPSRRDGDRRRSAADMPDRSRAPPGSSRTTFTTRALPASPRSADRGRDRLDRVEDAAVRRDRVRSGLHSCPVDRADPAARAGDVERSRASNIGVELTPAVQRGRSGCAPGALTALAAEALPYGLVAAGRTGPMPSGSRNPRPRASWPRRRGV